jgi:hypothetical protein
MNLKNPHVIWASVAIVFMLIAGSVTLTALGKDTAVILSLAAVVAAPVLGAFGVAIYQKVDQVKDLANGTTMTLQRQLQEAHQKCVELAQQIPTPAIPDGTTTTTTTTYTEPAP